MNTETLTHPKCGQSWTGTRAAHCAGCCLTFSSTTAFDMHQRLNDGVLTCEAPEKVSLVPVDKPWGVMWGCPRNGDNPWAHGEDGAE